MIDLRSDTVTRPSAEMKEAMMAAPLGDDVFGDDPSVNALEEKAASIFGKEASIFCPSGTMTNQIALSLHLDRGDEVICHEHSHIYKYEGGGTMANAGASVRLLPGAQGFFSADDVKANINPDDPHFPVSRLVSVENTHNKGGGSCWDLEALKEIRKVCDRNQMKMHLDGARLFNAIVAKGHDPKDFGMFDTISICMSKGLGAPVGSLLLGTKEDVKQARRIRKRFGGGMRQAGLLAAAVDYALDHNVQKLADDHRRASELGQVLSELDFVEEVLPVMTNIVVFRISDRFTNDDFLQLISEKGIHAVPFGPQLIRFVTHLDYDDDALNQTLEILRSI